MNSPKNTPTQKATTQNICEHKKNQNTNRPLIYQNSPLINNLITLMNLVVFVTGAGFLLINAFNLKPVVRDLNRSVRRNLNYEPSPKTKIQNSNADEWAIYFDRTITLDNLFWSVYFLDLLSWSPGWVLLLFGTVMLPVYALIRGFFMVHHLVH